MRITSLGDYGYGNGNEILRIAESGTGEYLNWRVQMGIDAFGNELKEFWPDIHRRLSKKKHSAVAVTPDCVA